MKTPEFATDFNVGGKTPEEIKRNLRGCRDKELCQFCDDESHCKDKRNALAYIQHLETRLAQAERERDAAVADLCDATKDEPYKDCLYCKHKEKETCEVCEWQWRGV